MKTVIYHCDICRDKLKENEKEPALKTFIGAQFGSSNTLEIASYTDVHRHFCLDCLRSLVDIYTNKSNEKKCLWREKGQ